MLTPPAFSILIVMHASSSPPPSLFYNFLSLSPSCSFSLPPQVLLLLHASYSFPCCFLVRIGEFLEKGIENAIVLEADEALVLHAVEEFDDVMPDGVCVYVCACVRACMCVKSLH